jgi:hypothetical protein
MSENWSTWIIGNTYDGPLGRRPDISFCYFSASQAVQFLATRDEYQQGAAFISYHTPPQHRLIAGLGRTARFVSLRELVKKARLSTFTGLDSSDFGFVPFEEKAHPITRSQRAFFHWADEQDLPHVYVHDNDHVWFSGFPRRMETHIFTEFLKISVFNVHDRTLRISRSDWAIIRKGLFRHGYTMNRSLCSYDKGIITYVLWTGIPEVTLLQTNAHSSLSLQSEKLVLTIMPNDTVRLQKETGRCPLTSDYGVLE